MDKPKPIVIYEQQAYQGTDKEAVLTALQKQNVVLSGLPNEFMKEPSFLGIDSQLQASYFIGATWLIKDKLPVIVRPKVENVDIADMLIKALSISTETEAEYFSKCYRIDFTQNAIESEEDQTQLTPLLVVHYLTLLEQLVKHGLKKDYITVTENLGGKLKGHLIINAQLRQNIIPKREDRNVCRYQVYTTDIPMNRLLKRALLFADRMLKVFMHRHKQFGKLKMRTNKLLAAFENVSDNIEISQVKSMASNKLFRHYSEAIRVAKEILRRYDYSISNISSSIHTTPPFWIDMSRLFEMYVLSLLRDAYGQNVLFQVEGYNEVADYVLTNENLVLDAKYKKWYANDGVSSDMIKDIREISGNARDVRIVRNLLEPDNEPECVIIYPSHNGVTSFPALLTDEAHRHPIRQFRRFYKIPVKLPTLR